jgi:hypothetical protein
MSKLIDEIIKKLGGEYFIPVMGLFYLGIKIVMKNFLDRLSMDDEDDFDLWPVIAWFGVDLAVLSIALSIALHSPNRRGYSETESILWYALMIISTLISSFFYAFFNKRRKALSNESPLKHPILLMLLIGCIFFGSIFFSPTIQVIHAGVK